MTIRALTLTLAAAAMPAMLPAQQGHDHHAGHARHAHPAQTAQDSGFAALQARGEQAMGVDQYTSTHRFDALPDGAEGVATIRAHLRQIADAFSRGDFATPAFVHATAQVPGTDVMAARRAHVRYVYRDLPRGGEVRIVTEDAEALRAIHAFMAFQRTDHHAGGIHP